MEIDGYKVSQFSKARFLYPDQTLQAQKELERRQQDKIRRQNENQKTRRAQIEKLTKDNEKVDIEVLLMQNGLDLNNIPKNVEWIPLEKFDDVRFDDRSPQEWLDYFKDEEGNKILFEAKALIKEDNEFFMWVPCQVESYDPEDAVWEVKFPEGDVMRLKRLQLLFDVEDRPKFVERLTRAAVERIYMDSYVRYNFYINAMPVGDLGALSSDSVASIIKLAKNSWKLRENDQLDVESEIESMQGLYIRTMNKILFNKYLKESEEKNNFLPNMLVLPELEAEEVPAPEQGMVAMQKADFTYEPKGEDYSYPSTKEFSEIFQEVCLESILSKKCVVLALQNIKSLCLEVRQREVFKMKIDRELSYEEFLHEQQQATSSLISSLKSQWNEDVIRVIYSRFEHEKDGWFNIKEANPKNYKLGKLDSFLNLVRLEMQDTLHDLVDRNFHQYVSFIESFVPSTTTIHSLTHIENGYGDDYVQSSLQEEDFKRLHIPLFSVDLLINEGKIQYSNKPSYFKGTVIKTFKLALQELGTVPGVEAKILGNRFGKRLDNYLRGPRLPSEEPDSPDPAERPKQYVDQNLWVWELYQKLEGLMDQAIAPLNEYIGKFEYLDEVLSLNGDALVEKYNGETNKKPISFIFQEIAKFSTEAEKTEASFLKSVQVGCFKVNCKAVKKIVKGIYSEVCEKLKNVIEMRISEQTKQIEQGFIDIEDEIYKEAKDIEGLTALNEFIEMEMPTKIDSLKNQTLEVMAVFDRLEEMEHSMKAEDLARRWKVFKSPSDIYELAKERDSNRSQKKNQLLEHMCSNQVEFKQRLEDLEGEIAGYYNNINIKLHVEKDIEVRRVFSDVKEVMDQSRKFNSREELFGRDKTDYTKISKMMKEFEPYYNLWTTVHGWYDGNYRWTKGDWEKVNASEASNFVDDGSRKLAGVLRFFNDKDPIYYTEQIAISKETKKQIDDFKVKVPLLVALRKEGMCARHWRELSAETGVKLNPDNNPDFSFEWLLEQGMMSNLQVCQKVGEKAKKEFQIERSLVEMEEVWAKEDFVIEAFKKNMNVIKGFDAVEEILDEHLATTGMMMVNPYNKFYEQRIEDWNLKMVTVSNVIEDWRRFQGQWAYLQPIFSSDDIKKHLYEEAAKFKQVNIFQKTRIDNVRLNPNALEVSTEEGFLEQLQELNISLDEIQQGLNSYLEAKRAKFARFYFLADDELLQILSQTKEVERVQDHLRKVFENIKRLNFDQEKQITAMYSVDGEKVDFEEHVDPVRRNVEDWMSEVEERMKISVRQRLLASVEDYPSKPRTKWIFDHPGQCVLNGSQVVWTQEVENAIREGKLSEFIKKLEQQLLDLVQVDRTGFTKRTSVIVEALIVIDVHAKEVVQKLLELQVDDIGAFEWISQLRYYWENDDCFVKCIQTNFPYGYEYLGNTSRLVITPLTDKCYMTLMGALKLNLGGAPAGPAGTGKTETTKDLAKALAKQCNVFNCQESMGYQFVGKYFKGLASSGAWCCFDEFNRINIEVLSVIAQQLQELFQAKAKGIDEIMFEGTRIRVFPTFSVYITMNPGYAGRTELPDNLKALFRPVAMMVPDYSLIAEIKLYSYGFTQARTLAKKMVATFTLASEQLSSQKHYDYGMRAVSSVYSAAGLLKRITSESSEEKLLLRALRDVNVPKFLREDIPLFENIITDLFPDTEQPQYEYGLLMPALQAACANQNLKPIQPFIAKVLQLQDTMQVRHGLMIVGPTGGGKTSNYRVLSEAISSLAGEAEQYKKVNIDIMNPKAVTLEELYGISKDMNWEQGIIEIQVEKAIQNQNSDEYNWIMFDGPVDAVWIESMNTVLDDNKKLCLSSGKVLNISSLMTMMFEVEDLEEASPATVSRCGMVYMEPESMGLEHLFESYVNTWPQIVRDKNIFVPSFTRLLEAYFYPMLKFVRESCNETVQTFDNCLVMSFTKLFDVLAFEPAVKSVDHVEALFLVLEDLVIFCVIWSVLCTVDAEGRVFCDQELRRQMLDKKSRVSLPEDSQVYDWQFNREESTWTAWIAPFKDHRIEADEKFAEIVVPTNDFARMTYLSQRLLVRNHHVMTPGPTGTGKSVIAFKMLATMLPEDFTSISIALSAQTTASQILNTIWNQCDRRGSSSVGPPQRKKCVVFVDDLNMPKKEIYGAQPPIELLRQYLDHKAWYIFAQNKEYINVQDIIFMTAMGPPGGGRNFITARMTRHFNMLTYAELTDSTIASIFETMLGHFLARFQVPVRESISNVVAASIRLYNTSRKVLLPKPGKSHYTFNLRDIGKVFQGLCAASPKHILQLPDLARLWVHENMRVYHDRLTTDEDRQLFIGSTLEVAKDIFSLERDTLMNCERLIFCDFMGEKGTGLSPYHQVTDLPKFVTRVEEYLEEYNHPGNKNQMHLVMFLDACEHVSRMCRTLRQPNGHMLLMGVGGSGRQSLARLASYILELGTFQIELVKNYGLKDWREDLKSLVFAAIRDNKPTTFLFVDTQIIDENFVEDINCLLNTGDVVGLPFTVDDEKDLDEVAKNICSSKGLVPNKINKSAQRLMRVKSNVHMVLAMSPLSDKFATRLRMFPSLINCCTLDWFSEWPNEALLGVGRGQLEQYADEFKIRENFDKVVDMFRYMHKSVETISERYLKELRRHNYVTPTSYLELLSMYKKITIEKNNRSNNLFKRFKDGLEKLRSSEEDVKKLEEKLRRDTPLLEEANKKTEALLEVLKVDKAKADEQKKVVALQEKEAGKKQAAANEIALIAREKNQEAQDKLEEVMKVVRQITPGNLVELRSFSKVAEPIQLVACAICILMLNDPSMDKIQDTHFKNPLKIDVDKAWDIAKKNILSKPGQLITVLLEGFDMTNISNDRLRVLRKKCMSNERWTRSDMESSNDANKYMYYWVEGAVSYNTEFKNQQPIRDQLAATEEELQKTTAFLNEKKEELAKVNARLDALQEKFSNQKKQSEQLSRQINESRLRLERASKLTALLADEKTRWGEEIKTITYESQFIPHNSLVAAGMVAYAGPFVSEFRKELEEDWVRRLGELGLVHSPNTRMASFLGDPVKILDWNLKALPKDETSIENGIIIENSKRWPLLIDPQTQGNKYIKNMGQAVFENFEPMKASNPKLINTLKQMIMNGQWVLMENVGEDLDPSLDPLLTQKIVEVGGDKNIEIGGEMMKYSDDFRLFMTSTHPNPHYSPEISAKVTIINFGITPKGLEEQMLAQIVIIENPDTEQRKTDIVQTNAEDRRKLKELEDQILENLYNSDDFLMDETLINKLSESKQTSGEINQRMEESKIAEVEIDRTRESYRSAATRASLLYFCIVDLSKVNDMYQYSLQWFAGLFKMGIINSTSHPDTEVRLKNIIEYFTYSLYENVCRSLFGRHKLLFSFILTIQIMRGEGRLDLDEWSYLIQGPQGDIKISENPTTWIAENSWAPIYRQMYSLDKLKNFEGILAHFVGHLEEWRTFYDNNEPQEAELPAPYQEQLSKFQRVLVMNALRPDKAIQSIQIFVEGQMGKKFVEVPIFKLKTIYKDSNCVTPLIFVLSTGSDPKADFDKLVDEMDIKNTKSISLGQGQGGRATEMIKDLSSPNGPGGWVLLQNCHLATSWMPKMEALCENFNPDLTHPDFRLWLTSIPSPKFPISVLQNSVKVTLEPPSGIKDNLKQSYQQLDDAQLSACSKPETFKKLLFGLCFFHAILQERKRFGPIGWNKPYDFTAEDLFVSRSQLQLFIDEYSEIPFKVLKFICAEINYGGRVTDSNDKILIATLIKKYITPEILEDNYKFSESGTYFSPEAGVQADYLNYINSLPLNPRPEVFGLHDNAEITNAQAQTRSMLHTVLSIQARASSGSGNSREDIIQMTIKILDQKLEPAFDLKEVARQYPTKYEESMNTVLVQEIQKYNRLIKIIEVSLNDVKRGLQGLISMNEELEEIADCLYKQVVPVAWGHVFLSLKPLMSWIEDFKKRVDFMRSWVEKGKPAVFWFSGFCFPQAFITGTLQNYARVKKVAIDRISFSFRYIDDAKPENISEPPEFGVYVSGMFLEGARWDYDKHCIEQPRAKELYSELPMVHLVPEVDREVPETGIYRCPLYKVISRYGQLSTTGHSTNFVMFVEMPTAIHSDEWIRAGVASFLALRDQFQFFFDIF